MAKNKPLDVDAIHPILVSETCWMYAEDDALCVVKEDRDASGKVLKTLQIEVPWSKVKQALQEREAKS